VSRRPIVRTGGGAVRGLFRDGVHAFLGIPYAAPPFGAGRFAEPHPHEPWDGVREATEYGATAPKPPRGLPFGALLPEPVIPGEDCLNLNVWTPDPLTSGLPVFVWIHGGGFSSGSGAAPAYDGAAFARDGVVCVTINYRLGVDGFLQFTDDGPANRGLLDQEAALRWVQHNIAAFGGDPARVTIGGGSAGGISVACLLGRPSAKGLFAQAVLQSGAGHHALPPAAAVRMAGHLAERLHVAPERQALAGVPLDELLAAQQTLAQDAQLLVDPARWGEDTTDLVFGPVIDGDVVLDLPILRITAGSARYVPILIGANRDEWRLFLVPNGLVDGVDDALLSSTATRYGLDAGALEIYRASRPGGSAGEVLADVITDWYFRIPAIRMAEAQADVGGGAWMYEFSWPSPRFGGRLGACHGLELSFVFDTLDPEALEALPDGEKPRALATETHRAWVQFISEGDPGWPRYDRDRRPVQDFGQQVRLVEDPRKEQRALWAALR
jgi:para-nitrobenzyl esterase